MNVGLKPSELLVSFTPGINAGVTDVSRLTPPFKAGISVPLTDYFTILQFLFNILTLKKGVSPKGSA